LQLFFRLGIFTSASIRTVGTVKVLIEKEAGVPLFEPQLILSRNHTTPAPKHHVQVSNHLLHCFRTFELTLENDAAKC
jgi:hypothetical protein